MIGLNRFFMEAGMSWKWCIDTLGIEYQREQGRRGFLKLLFFSHTHFNRNPFVAKWAKILRIGMYSYVSAKYLPDFYPAATIECLRAHSRAEARPIGCPDTTLPIYVRIFGRNPDRLCLNGQFDGFRVFIEACEPMLKFEKLKALDLEVLSILFQDPSDQHEDKAILMNTVAPFVRCHAPTLENLGVKSGDPVDFSDFYDYLAATDFWRSASKCLSTKRWGSQNR